LRRLADPALVPHTSNEAFEALVMRQSIVTVVAAALLASGSLLAPTQAEAWHFYRGGEQAARCTAAYEAARQHRPHTPCFSRHTAGFSFARGATTPFYAGITDQYDGGRRRGPYHHSTPRHRHGGHAMKIAK
jgi:hypothetical protein